MGRTPESHLSDKIIAALREAFPRAVFWKQIAGGGSVVGLPDIAGVVEGRAVQLEVKTSRGKASKVQVYRMERLRGAGTGSGR